jgi:hypothetical protein
MPIITPGLPHTHHLSAWRVHLFNPTNTNKSMSKYQDAQYSTNQIKQTTVFLLILRRSHPISWISTLSTHGTTNLPQFQKRNLRPSLRNDISKNGSRENSAKIQAAISTHRRICLEHGNLLFVKPSIKQRLTSPTMNLNTLTWRRERRLLWNHGEQGESGEF